jgi:hypothetical protein
MQRDLPSRCQWTTAPLLRRHLPSPGSETTGRARPRRPPRAGPHGVSGDNLWEQPRMTFPDVLDALDALEHGPATPDR